MEVTLAGSCGFCFGVKRAISLAESTPGATTLGPLIHNDREIARLNRDHNIAMAEAVEEIAPEQSVIIRTHGIPKQELIRLQEKTHNIIDATCPYVTKPQQICEKMAQEGYQVVIFGDAAHPEVKGVLSYAGESALVVLQPEELQEVRLREKIALVSQTTRKLENFLRIAQALIERCSEVRVFNTICNATHENQEAARSLSRQSDVMVVVGGKNSSNTRQLLRISQEHCKDSYLVEDENDLEEGWFLGKMHCGITAGASTPDWIIRAIVEKISRYGIQ